MSRAHHGRISHLAQFFTNRQDCRILRRDAYKVLLRAHDQGPQGQDYFVKIYRHPHLFHSRVIDWKLVGGGQEYRMCKKLRSLGIATPEPVGFATDRNWAGYPRQSLYASIWLQDSHTLDAILRGQHARARIDASGWQQFIGALGRFVGRLQLKLVNAKDLNTMNILVMWPPGDKPRFFLVDYERTVILRKYDLARFMNALSQIGAGLIPVFEGDIEQLCKGYASVVDHIDARDLTRQVRAASREKSCLWQQEIDGLFDAIGQRMHDRGDSKAP